MDFKVGVTQGELLRWSDIHFYSIFKSVFDNIVKFMLKQPVFVRSQLGDCSTLKEELNSKTGDPWIDFVTN